MRLNPHGEHGPLAGSSGEKAEAPMVEQKPKRSVPRYAIYYAPEPGSELHAFGEAWFNGAAARGSRLDRAKVSALTEGPRLYGFHGTLKPPFELNPTFTEAGLVEAARVFAKGVSPI